jgi:CRP-like cAMP-binding protein
MARRLQDLVFQLESVSSRSTVERLAHFTLRLYDRASGDCRIALPLDKNLIAARLGMQPETLSRGLAKLRSAGVETDGHGLGAHNVTRVRQFTARDEGR